MVPLFTRATRMTATTTITDNQPHPTGGVAEFQCTLDGSDYVISCRFGGVASEVLRYPSAGIGSMKPIVARYYFGASTLPITGMTTGFVNATLPVGALDNDWYEVSAGGYFHGKTTRAGQFVKLISGKTNLIVVDKPADPGTSSLEAVTVTHFSDINTTGLAEPRLYVVTADETNANQRTQYLYDGSALMWLVALEA